jgi:hypothetical protein
MRMKQLLTVTANRLARTDGASADRTDHLRTVGVVNATVWAEDDILARLHSQATERAGGEFWCHGITSNEVSPAASEPDASRRDHVTTPD